MLRLDDVESKLAETEKEAEKSRKDSKNARDAFSDVKQRRYGSFLRKIPKLNATFVVLNYSTKRTTTSRSALTRFIRILPRVRQPPWAASPISAWRTMRYGWEDASCTLTVAFIPFSYVHSPFSGTILGRYQVSRHASYETISRYGAAVWWRENGGGAGPTLCDPQVQNFDSGKPFFVSDMRLCAVCLA